MVKIKNTYVLKRNLKESTVKQRGHAAGGAFG